MGFMNHRPAAADPGPGAGASSHLAEGLELRGRRRLKAAAASFERAVEAEPARAEGWFWLAVTRDNRGQEAEAIPAYRRALSLGLADANRRAQAWTWLASSLSKTGQHAAALAALAEADRLGGYRPAEEYQRLRRAVQRRPGRARS
jgi:tetratricopeptide (TPR) repeat protein